MKVILATRNEGKVREIKDILGGLRMRFSSLEVSSLEEEEEKNKKLLWEENGKTFLENVKIKAYCVQKEFCENVLAEDSGLVIPVLNGEPGVYSARYGSIDGEKLDSRSVNELILKKMRGFHGADREAYFESVCVLVLSGGKEIIGEGKVFGEIEHELKGGHGFGFDSIFYVKKANKTYGEMDFHEKNKMSHRAIALEMLRKRLEIYVLK